MTVINIASSASSNTGVQSPLQQAKTNFATLAQSLQSGNLAAAQQAFARLQQNAPKDPNDPLQKQADALGQALQSGNLSAAQQAFAALQQNWQTMSSSGAVAAQSTTGTAASGLSLDV